MEGNVVQVLIPSTAGLTNVNLASVGLSASASDSTAGYTTVSIPVSSLGSLGNNVPVSDILSLATAAAIHTNGEPPNIDDDTEAPQAGETDLQSESELNSENAPTVLEIKTEQPPPLEAPTQIHPVTLQAHQLQTATLLPTHTIIEMLPQNLIEHQQLLQQQQQQLQQQQQQLQQHFQQQQNELQQQQQGTQQQQQPKTGKGSKKQNQVAVINNSNDENNPEAGNNNANGKGMLSYKLTILTHFFYISDY
ncbi:hypothetical protein ACF0H5_000959 [Mactra antiquata]